MRKLASTLLVVAVVLPVAARADDPAPMDWVIFKVTAGPEGAESVHAVHALEAESVPGQAMLHGFGWGRDDGYLFFDVRPLSSGEATRVATSQELGGQTLEVTEGQSGGGLSLSGIFSASRLGPNETHAFLRFFPGGSLVEFFAPPAFAAIGSVEVTVVSGAGSRGLRAADPDDTGPAVGAGPVVAGLASDTLDSATGLAGAYVAPDLCLACVGMWTSPTRTGVMADSVVAGSGDFVFADGSGTWEWSWLGAGIARSFVFPVNSPVYAAYAPIGDEWRFFAQR